jgi:hypothetical protein
MTVGSALKSHRSSRAMPQCKFISRQFEEPTGTANSEPKHPRKGEQAGPRRI